MTTFSYWCNIFFANVYKRHLLPLNEQTHNTQTHNTQTLTTQTLTTQTLTTQTLTTQTLTTQTLTTQTLTTQVQLVPTHVSLQFISLVYRHKLCDLGGRSPFACCWCMGFKTIFIVLASRTQDVWKSFYKSFVFISLRLEIFHNSGN